MTTDLLAGQSHSALILLYRAVPLPSVEEDESTPEAGKAST